MGRLRKWIVTVGLIFVMTFSFVGPSYAFLDDLIDALNSFFSSAEDFINSIVTSFNYLGSNLVSIRDWTTGTVTYYAGGNPTYVIGIMPDGAKLYNYLVGQGLDDDYLTWINNNYEKYKALDTDNDGTIEDDEARDIGAIAAFLEDNQGYSTDRILDIIAENSTLRTTYYVYDDTTGILEFTYFYITDEKGNEVTVTGTSWDPENGICNGKRAQVTLYDNGRIDKIIGWTKDGETDQWQMKTAQFFDSDNDGTNDYAIGALDLIGIDIPRATGFTAEYGKVEFDSLGRINKVYIDANGDGKGTDGDGFESLAAAYTYDAQGRLTMIEVYDDSGTAIAKVEMTYEGNRLATQTVMTKDGGSWEVQSITSYHYGDNNVLLYAKTITQGERTEEVTESEVGQDLNGDGDQLDTIKYTYATTTTDITWYLFGRSVFATSETEETEIGKQVTRDIDPRRHSPTVTGNLSYNAENNTWHMDVYVWTGVGDPNNIHVDRNYWNSLSEEEKQRIKKMAEEAGGKVVIEENPITIELDISNLSESDLEFLQNNIGNILTVHGWTIDGLIKNGYILEVVGFGKWGYEPYHPYDE